MLLKEGCCLLSNQSLVILIFVLIFSLSVVALSFGLIEVVGLVLACCLGDRIHRAKHYHRFIDIVEYLFKVERKFSFRHLLFERLRDYDPSQV